MSEHKKKEYTQEVLDFATLHGITPEDVVLYNDCSGLSSEELTELELTPEVLAQLNAIKKIVNNNNLLMEFNAKKAVKKTRAGSGITDKIRSFILSEKEAGTPIVKITASMLGADCKDFGMGPVYAILKKMGIKSREQLVSNVTDEIKHRADEILIKL